MRTSAHWLVATSALTAFGGCGAQGVARLEPRAPEPALSFVRVEGGRFMVDDEPYRFVGANLWWGANLASLGPGGDRARLDRELDRLRALGVTNLRILGGSEGPASEPWRIAPPLQRAPGDYDEQVLDGLDYLISAIARRGMRAVVCLTNFWFWSGGMAQYLAWNGAGDIPYPLAPGGSWHEYQRYTARFYSYGPAVEDFERHVTFLLERENPYTGRAYREEPAIMAWELANEPRGMDRPESMRGWIHRTAGLIKALDERHLVTTGSEGDTDLPLIHGTDFLRDHQSPHIDYATVHLWVQNWRWFDPGDAEGTYPRAEGLAVDYLRSHVQRAEALGKPLVFEEFGMSRDRGSFDPSAPTGWRDRYFRRLFGLFLDDVACGGPLQGVSFWAWAGEGRPEGSAGDGWRVGEDWIGDPPHEPQGWYSVYDEDLTTLGILADAAAALVL